jgi:hypothetical protein
MKTVKFATDQLINIFFLAAALIAWIGGYRETVFVIAFEIGALLTLIWLSASAYLWFRGRHARRLDKERNRRIEQWNRLEND